MKLNIKQEEWLAFKKIVESELLKSKITWAHFVYGGKVRPVQIALWSIIWRARRELNLPKFRIATYLEVDHTTVTNALKRMDETDGKFFENLPPLHPDHVQTIKRRLKKINRDIGDEGEVLWP